MATRAIEASLYGGRHTVVFNPNARGRTPRYKVDGVARKGVTTILGDTIAKKGLFTWPLDLAISYLKERCPVITEADLKEAANQHNLKRDAGAGTGTEAHELVEQLLLGRTPDTTGRSAESIKAYEAFTAWYAATKPVVLGVENVIYSARYGYAGTYDCLLEVDGQCVLGDLKTTNPSREAPKGVYAENFLQLGAYAYAHEEQRAYESKQGQSDLRQIEDLMIISCKKNGKTDIVCASDLGLSVHDCMKAAIYTINVWQTLQDLKAKLEGK